MESRGGGQDGGGVGGHARPLPQTQQKKHIYRRNDSHRTTTNRWQRNLNSNNGKKFVTLLGRTGEKRRVREGESQRDGRSQKGTAEEKGIPQPGKSPTGQKIKRTGGISRCREECSSKLEYGKADQEPNGPSELRAQSPKIEMPGWGLGTETSAPDVSPWERAWGGEVVGILLGRSRNQSVKFDWAETAWETRKQSCHRGREKYSRGGEVERHIRGNLGEEPSLRPCWGGERRRGGSP